eukprot:299426-Pyramimonas_sp.AAC.2
MRGSPEALRSGLPGERCGATFGAARWDDPTMQGGVAADDAVEVAPVHQDCQYRLPCRGIFQECRCHFCLLQAHHRPVAPAR